MNGKKPYRVVYVKTTVITRDIKADNKQDAEFVAKLKAPAGYEPGHIYENLKLNFNIT